MMAMKAVARSQAMDTFFDCIEFRKILQWTPDKSLYCKSLEERTGRDIRTRFGMSPLWVACFACFANELSE